MQDHGDIRAILEAESFVDRLASEEHERWAHWQQYVHDQCAAAADGSLIIPADLVVRWRQQIATPYAELSDAERESDRQQVRRYLPLIVEALTREG